MPPTSSPLTGLHSAVWLQSQLLRKQSASHFLSPHWSPFSSLAAITVIEEAVPPTSSLLTGLHSAVWLQSQLLRKQSVSHCLSPRWSPFSSLAAITVIEEAECLPLPLPSLVSIQQSGCNHSYWGSRVPPTSSPLTDLHSAVWLQSQLLRKQSASHFLSPRWSPFSNLAIITVIEEAECLPLPLPSLVSIQQSGCNHSYWGSKALP